MRHIPDSVVCTTLASLDWLGLGHEREAILARWRGDNVDIATGLRVIGGPEELPSADLYYTLFLNNAHALLPVVRARRIPFAFTLYPGGGLAFNASAAVRLREVLAEPLLARVVITQPAVLEYVISNQLVSPSKIEYIFGIALGPDDSPEPTRVSGPPSLAFVAHRYHPKGHDKGLDLFVAACERLLNAGLPLTARIIGPWRRTDLDSVRDPSRYVLHGALGSHDLQLLLRSIEIAVFPTRQGILASGAFDGFPKGSAITAGLAGVAVLSTNPLDRVTPLRPGRDYVSIEATVESILEALEPLVASPEGLLQIRVEGQRAMRALYSEDAQLWPRERMLGPWKATQRPGVGGNSHRNPIPCTCCSPFVRDRSCPRLSSGPARTRLTLNGIRCTRRSPTESANSTKPAQFAEVSLTSNWTMGLSRVTRASASGKCRQLVALEIQLDEGHPLPLVEETVESGHRDSESLGVSAGADQTGQGRLQESRYQVRDRYLDALLNSIAQGFWTSSTLGDAPYRSVNRSKTNGSGSTAITDPRGPTSSCSLAV